MNKFPFIIIVGEQDEKDGTISVRKHGGENIGTVNIEAFSNIIKEEIDKTLKKFDV